MKSLGGVIDTRMCSSSDKAENAMLAHPLVDPSRAQLQVPGDSDEVGLTVVKSISLNSKTNDYPEDRGKVNECKGPKVVQNIPNPRA